MIPCESCGKNSSTVDGASPKKRAHLIRRSHGKFTDAHTTCFGGHFYGDQRLAEIAAPSISKDFRKSESDRGRRRHASPTHPRAQTEDQINSVWIAQEINRGKLLLGYDRVASAFGDSIRDQTKKR